MHEAIKIKILLVSSPIKLIVIGEKLIGANEIEVLDNYDVLVKQDSNICEIIKITIKELFAIGVSVDLNVIMQHLVELYLKKVQKNYCSVIIS